MARLRNARSSSLREKIHRMGAQGSLDHEKQNSDDPVIDEVRRKLWLVCQTSIRQEPFVSHDNRKREDKLVTSRPTLEPEASPELDLVEYWLDFDDLGDAFHGEEEDTDIVIYDHMLEQTPFSDFSQETFEDDIVEGEEFLSYDPHYNGLEDRTSSDDDWLDDAEADYFYTDGQGNFYPVERQQSLELGELERPLSPQPSAYDSESDGYSQGFIYIGN
ncbi:hypothetical protein B0H63DRAFT_150130 [Podospora didyma]|uniref:Transcription factor Iwr1 domain-containing protein n=1 Tax=Podospora didyma TaxID=330526 RepID=A0AAE0NT35_9PEZI|nr:hypothetical protein B0H63DRAFT_150130 [Podospora didyma]